jgi:hypothetical protein
MKTSKLSDLDILNTVRKVIRENEDMFSVDYFLKRMLGGLNYVDFNQSTLFWGEYIEKPKYTIVINLEPIHFWVHPDILDAISVGLNINHGHATDLIKNWFGRNHVFNEKSLEALRNRFNDSLYRRIRSEKRNIDTDSDEFKNMCEEYFEDGFNRLKKALES